MRQSEYLSKIIQKRHDLPARNARRQLKKVSLLGLRRQVRAFDALLKPYDRIRSSGFNHEAEQPTMQGLDLAAPGRHRVLSNKQTSSDDKISQGSRHANQAIV